MRARTLTSAVTLAVGLALALSGSPAVALAPTGASPGLSAQAGRTSQRQHAEHVLAEARSLFAAAPALARRTGGTVPPRRDATLVLRDLRLSMGALAPSDRRAAGRILARPTDGIDPTGGFEPKYTVPEATPFCSATACVHYVTTTVHRVPPLDSDGDGVPNQVESTLATLTHVRQVENGRLRYTAPVSDATVSNNGGDGRLDVYLGNLTIPGGVLFGYCAPEDNARVSPGYCVLDNDYSPADYGTRHTPLENLQVTAAHEYFHAVQFGYDSTEDAWLMEGTAAWMEDEVYDRVNDNLVYLSASPLRFPGVPLDFTDNNYPPYGPWIFWRFLSDSAVAGVAGSSPTVVRQVWERARGVRYSTNALKATLAARGASFTGVFRTFGTWNRAPARFYSEGRLYPAAPLNGRFTLTPAHRSVATRARVLNHMAHSYQRFTPGSTLRGAWRLRITVNMPARSRGSYANVAVHRRGGAISNVTIPLDRRGDGSKVVAFSRASVNVVELDLINASTRFDCRPVVSFMSCGGRPLDDGLRSTFRAAALR